MSPEAEKEWKRETKREEKKNEVTLTPTSSSSSVPESRAARLAQLRKLRQENPTPTQEFSVVEEKGSDGEEDEVNDAYNYDPVATQQGLSGGVRNAQANELIDGISGLMTAFGVNVDDNPLGSLMNSFGPLLQNMLTTHTTGSKQSVHLEAVVGTEDDHGDYTEDRIALTTTDDRNKVTTDVQVEGGKSYGSDAESEAGEEHEVIEEKEEKEEKIDGAGEEAEDVERKKREQNKAALDELMRSYLDLDLVEEEAERTPEEEKKEDAEEEKKEDTEEEKKEDTEEEKKEGTEEENKEDTEEETEEEADENMDEMDEMD
jgi:hypothetical protein